MEQFEISDQLKEKLGKAKSLDEVVQFCREEGIEITKEQLEMAAAQGDGGELDEDTLDNVSGGGLWVSAHAGMIVARYLLKHFGRYLII